MHSIKHYSFFFICILMGMLISACGSRGDLYQVAEPEAAPQSVIETDEPVEQSPSNEDKKKQS